MDIESRLRRSRALLLSPWSGSISSSQKFSRPENADHSTNIPGQLAIIAFVVVLIVIIIAFSIILYLSRRRRRLRERRLAEEAERQHQQRTEEEKKNCRHVLVIFPGDTIGCAEIQQLNKDEDVYVCEEEDQGSSSSSSSSISCVLPSGDRLRMAPLRKAVAMPSTMIDFLLAIEGTVKSYDGIHSSVA